MERYILSPDLYPERVIRLWLYQDQCQRLLIGFGSLNHMILATYRLMIDWFRISDSGRPQALMTLRIWWYECALWIITNLLFRHLDRFFWFRRPSKAYRFSVYTIIFIAPLPLLIMYIWTIVLAAAYDRNHIGRLPFTTSLWSAVTALVLLLPIHGFYIRLAKRFLLMDSDAKYEPTSPIRCYRDYASSSVPVTPRGHSCLQDAWTDSLESNQPAHTTLAETPSVSRTVAAGSRTTADAAVLLQSNTTPTIAGSANHCPATGYINNIPHSLRGHRAWLRYPLLYKLLAFYNTFLTWQTIVIIKAKTEDPQIKYDHPYGSLYVCLSVYALCFYSWRNVIGRSSFAKREPKPPSSIIHIRRRLGPTVFFDLNSNESINVENQHMLHSLRIHPTRHNSRASQTTEEPPLTSCRSHLGHLGHGFIASRRHIPFLCRTSIILLVVWYFNKGRRYLTTEPFPELPEGLTLMEWNYLMDKSVAISNATLRLFWYNGPVGVLVLVYATQAVMELVYEQIFSLKNISGAAAEHVNELRVAG